MTTTPSHPAEESRSRLLPKRCYSFRTPGSRERERSRGPEVWSPGSRLSAAFVLREFGSIMRRFPRSEQFNKVIPFVCVSRTYSRAPAGPAPSKCFTDVSGVAQRRPKKNVFLIQTKRPSPSSPCLMLWACVGCWSAHVGKYAL